MSITNHFEFPPPTKRADDLAIRELQLAAFEKQEILQFESYLAAASTKVAINESNSLLLSKLITMDPHGPARKPPSAVLEQFKSLNTGLRLGHLLCQSRHPDFLLQIIQRQQKHGTTNGSHHSGSSSSISAMPWLVELVESNEANFGMLPVQCLCEFLLGQISDDEGHGAGNLFSEVTKAEKSKKKEKRRKQLKLIAHLQQDVVGADETSAKELIGYFMKRLNFQQLTARQLASKALSLVLGLEVSAVGEESLFANFSATEVWLLRKLPSIPTFSSIRAVACDSLMRAILVETIPKSVACFVQFLANFSDAGSPALALAFAHLIIDRPIITNYLLDQVKLKDAFLDSIAKNFFEHLTAVKKPANETYSWVDAQDHVMVQWPATNEEAFLNISVVQAMMILLTFCDDCKRHPFDKLLQIWFSEPPPQAFLMDTSEEALLIPDYLKLRLLRANNSVLVEAGLKDLEPSQLILFIQSFGLVRTIVF